MRYPLWSTHSTRLFWSIGSKCSRASWPMQLVAKRLRALHNSSATWIASSPVQAYANVTRFIHTDQRFLVWSPDAYNLNVSGRLRASKRKYTGTCASPGSNPNTMPTSRTPSDLLLLLMTSTCTCPPIFNPLSKNSDDASVSQYPSLIEFNEKRISYSPTGRQC